MDQSEEIKSNSHNLIYYYYIERENSILPVSLALVALDQIKRVRFLSYFVI